MRSRCVAESNFPGVWPADLFEAARNEQVVWLRSHLPAFSKSTAWCKAAAEMGVYEAWALFAHLEPTKLQAVSDELANRILLRGDTLSA